MAPPWSSYFEQTRFSWIYTSSSEEFSHIILVCNLKTLMWFHPGLRDYGVNILYDMNFQNRHYLKHTKDIKSTSSQREIFVMMKFYKLAKFSHTQIKVCLQYHFHKLSHEVFKKILKEVSYIFIFKTLTLM